MATVTVLKFAAADGADGVLAIVQRLQKEHLIKLHDAAIVSWPVGKKSPRTRQLVDLTTAGALGGMCSPRRPARTGRDPMRNARLQAIGI